MPAKSHLESVHLLRGIAAFLVLFHHSFGWFPLPVLNDSVEMITGKGQLGVAIFFVISGFVLPLSMGSQYELRQFATFLSKRFIRIEPTYVVSVVFAACVLFLRTRLGPHGKPWIPDPQQFSAHLLYLIPFTHYDWLNPVYWTLAIEFQYYILIGLLLPVFLWASRKSFFLMAAFVALFASLIFLAPIEPQIGIFKQAPFFAVGLLFYDLFLNPKRFRSALVLGLVMMGLGIWSGVNPVSMTAGLICGFLIVFWRAAPSSWRILGTISFSLYVIHYPIAEFVSRTGKLFLTGSLEFALYFVPFVAILLSLIAAVLLYYLVEGPTQRVARAIRYQEATKAEEVAVA